LRPLVGGGLSDETILQCVHTLAAEAIKNKNSDRPSWDRSALWSPRRALRVVELGHCRHDRKQTWPQSLEVKEHRPPPSASARSKRVLVRRMKAVRARRSRRARVRRSGLPGHCSRAGAPNRFMAYRRRSPTIMEQALIEFAGAAAKAIPHRRRFVGQVREDAPDSPPHRYAPIPSWHGKGAGSGSSGDIDDPGQIG